MAVLLPQLHYLSYVMWRHTVWAALAQLLVCCLTAISHYLNQSWLLIEVMWYSLTLKHRETHGCVVSTVVTDALVLKHQVISMHNPDYTFIVLHIWWTTLENKITFWKIWPSRLRVTSNSKACYHIAILYIEFEIYTFKLLHISL